MKTILAWAVSDDQLRDLLLTDADKARAERDPTPIEMEATKETGVAEVRIRLVSRESVPECVSEWWEILPGIALLCPTWQGLWIMV